MNEQLDPIKKVALTLKAHLHGLLSYFHHRITNAKTGRAGLSCMQSLGRNAARVRGQRPPQKIFPCAARDTAGATRYTSPST